MRDGIRDDPLRRQTWKWADSEARSRLRPEADDEHRWHLAINVLRHPIRSQYCPSYRLIPTFATATHDNLGVDHFPGGASSDSNLRDRVSFNVIREQDVRKNHSANSLRIAHLRGLTGDDRRSRARLRRRSTNDGSARHQDRRWKQLRKFHVTPERLTSATAAGGPLHGWTSHWGCRNARNLRCSVQLHMPFLSRGCVPLCALR